MNFQLAVLIVILLLVRVKSKTLQSDKRGLRSLHWSSQNHINYEFRSERSANESFSTTLVRAQQISRITNGIALRQGLTNGAIDSDTLVSELLNLGSISPSAIKDIDADGLAGLVKGIQDLPGRLKPGDSLSAGVEKVEKRYAMYASMLKKTKGVGKGFKISKQDEYVKAVSKFVKDFKDVTDLKEASENLRQVLDDLTDLSQLRNSTGVNVRNKLLGLVNTFTNMKSIDTFKSLVGDPNLKNAELTFKDLISVHAAAEMYQEFSNVSMHTAADFPYIDKIGESIKALMDLAGKSKSSLPNFKSLVRLFASRRYRSGNRVQTLTPGFQTPSEISFIFQDLEDPWIKRAVNNTADSLSVALEPLKLLTSRTEILSNFLLLPVGDNVRLLEISPEVDRLSTYADKFDRFQANIKRAKLSASPDDMAPPNRQQFLKLLANMESFSAKLKAIETIIGVSAKLSESGGNRKDVEAVLEILKDSTNAKALSQLDALEKSQQFKKVREVLNSAESSLKELSSGDPPSFRISEVKTLAEKVSKEIGEIDTYIKGLDKFFEKMDELRKVEGIDTMEDAVTAIQSYRNFTPNGLNFASVSGQLTSAKTALVDLEKTIGGFKDSKSLNLESKNLMQLKDVLPESQTIGSATNVLSSIDSLDTDQIVIDQKSIDIIKNILVSVKGPQDKKNLDILVGPLNGELNTLYQEIDAFKSSFQPSSSSSSLASLHLAYFGAKNISGLPHDFRAIADSLRKVSKPGLDKTLTQLETLDSLGLNFATRHGDMDESKKALDDLDMMFAAYSKSIASSAARPKAPVPPAGAQRSNVPSGALDDQGGSTESLNWFEKHLVLLIIIGSVIVFLAIVFFIGLSIYCCCCCCRKKPAPAPVEIITPPVSPATEDQINEDKPKEDKPKDDSHDVEKGNTDSNSKETPAKPATQDEPVDKAVKPPAEDALALVPVPPSKEVTQVLPLDKTQESLRIRLYRIDAKVLESILSHFLSNVGRAKREKEWKGNLGSWTVDFIKMLFDADNGMTTANASNSTKAMEKWHRHNVTFSEKNRVALKKNGAFKVTYLHANIFTYPNGLRMIFMQGPQVKSENPEDPKECNIEMFYQMLIEQQADQIVQLTKFVEDGQVKVDVYLPLEKGQVVRFKKLKVTCVELVKSFDDELETRDLLFEFDGQKAPRAVQHILYTEWPDHGAPRRTDVAIGILNMIRENLNPIVVHCSAGIGRTGTFGLIELIYQTIATENKFHYGQILLKLRETRANAVQVADQYVFGFRCAIEYMAANTDLKKLDERWHKKLNDLRREMNVAVNGLDVEETQASFKDEMMIPSTSKTPEAAVPGKEAEPKEEKKSEKKSKSTKNTKGGQKKKKRKSKEPPV